jgi:hypothetical protein
LVYTIYLSDMLECFNKKTTVKQDTGDKLKAFYQKVLAKATPTDTVDVTWVTSAPTLKPGEVHVYFTSEEYSVVSRRKGKGWDPLGMGGHWGYTDFTEDAHHVPLEGASEVHVKIQSADILSKIAFHELMHQKLGLDNKKLHAKDGFAQAELDENSTLTASNIADMAAALRRPVAQWMGGFPLLVGAKAQRDRGDTFWYQ